MFRRPYAFGNPAAMGGASTFVGGPFINKIWTDSTTWDDATFWTD